MAKRNIITGIDVGTHTVRVVICEALDSTRPPRILGTGEAPSRGLRHGYIVNIEGTAKSISQAVARAEKISGVKVGRAFLSAGGIGLDGKTVVGTTLVSGSEGEVGDSDISKACNAAENFNKENTNRRVLNVIPILYQLDGKPVLGRVKGMKGVKLEVKALVITAQSQHISDLVSAADMANIEVIDVLPAPIAASCVSLNKQQKTAGCILANIGSETISVVVFEDNLPISLEIFPVGSTDITNDIALGLQIPLEEAEKLKLDRFHSQSNKQQLEEIIENRLSNVFTLIEAHLKKIDRNGLLPAGIVITGGGSGISTLEDLARASLSLPSSIGQLHYRTGTDTAEKERNKVKNIFKNAPSWSVAYGLCVLGSQSDQDESFFASSRDIFKSVMEAFFSKMKSFLP